MPKITEEPMNKKQKRQARQEEAKNPKPPKQVERPIIYPNVEVKICIGEKSLTATKAKELLGWETEDQYSERTGDSPSSTLFGDPLLTDDEKHRIQCWNNLGNRPFGESWCRSIAQDILLGNWKFNMETIVISKTGRITSGQHRLVGLVLAAEAWNAAKEKYEEIWPQEPTIEVLLAFGGSEDQDVLRTVDNVKPRSLSDVFYTSDYFAKLPSVDRKECSRMLDFAVDLLWKRTEAAETSGTKFQTHSASVDFLDRHPKLLGSVKHLFGENKERAISKLGLSPGQSSAVHYLQAAYETDGDVYRNGRPPSEKLIQWDYKEQADEFWTDISGLAKKSGDLREALAHCERPILRLAVLAKAWHLYAEGKKVTAADLELELIEDENGHMKLNENPDFLGIDSGYEIEATQPDEEPDETESDEAKAAQRDVRIKEMADKLKKNKEEQKAIKSIAEQFQELVKAHPGHTLLFKTKVGTYLCFGEQAEALMRVLKLKEFTKVDGVVKVTIPPAKYEEAVKELLAAKVKVAMVEDKIVDHTGKKKTTVTPLTKA